MTWFYWTATASF